MLGALYGEVKRLGAAGKALKILVLRAANKTLLASLPDLAVLLVLSAVVRLARIAALGFVSHSKLVCFLLDFPTPV